MSLLPERADSDAEEDFNWDDYLRETNSTAAPVSCFQQSVNPPVNKFEEGMKLEASDPRFPNINCAATVITKFGPKIRLRMIGAGANDDIWTLVDSRHIHPIGYTESRGGFLSPPFNCQRDGLRWANVLKNALTNVNANIAPEECFVSEPIKPKTNTFQVGQKLEACDFLSLNTTYVCPATIAEVKGDRIRVEFDGWNQSDWIKYDSREIFPVGYWGKAGITINPPPKKRAPVKRRHFGSVGSTTNHNFVNIFDSAKVYMAPSPKTEDDKSRIVTKEEERNVSPAPSSSSDSSRPATDKKISHHGLPKHTARKSVGLSSYRSASSSTPPTIVDGTDKRTVEANLPIKSETITPLRAVPPIVIKSSGTVSPSQMKRKSISPSMKIIGNGSCAFQESDVAIPGEDNAIETFMVYLNSSCAAGKLLDSSKLQASNARYGPGSVNNVMKSCLQLLIDCALDPVNVYHALPSGDGSSVSANFSGSPRIRNLPLFRSAFDGWKCLASVLDKLQACPHLFSRQLGDCLSCGSSTPANKSKPKIVATYSEGFSNDNDRKRHLSGGSNSSTCTERETGPVLSNDDIHKWNVDEVSRFISSVTDTSLGDLFKKQEIDGNALLILTADMMIRYMNVRLGPALKIANAVEKLKTPSTTVSGEH